MTKSRHIELEIPGLPQTHNAIGRKHWTTIANHSKRWVSAVQLYVSQTSLGFVPMKRANVTFTRVATRLMDPDNVPQTFKAVMDGLVRAHVLVDDGPENIVGLSYKQEKCKKGEEKIKIYVEEVL